MRQNSIGVKIAVWFAWIELSLGGQSRKGMHFAINEHASDAGKGVAFGRTYKQHLDRT